MANTDNGSQSFPINMYETDGALVVVAALPGVMLDDVNVEIDGRTMRITAGERSAAQKRDYLVHEWNYGPYQRDVDLPGDFAGKVEASFGNGQLAVRIVKGDGIPKGKVPVSSGQET